MNTNFEIAIVQPAVWVDPYSKKIKAKPGDPWTQPTKRRCLRCPKEFVAKGKYLRLCPTCREMNVTTYNCAGTFKLVDNCQLKDNLADDFQSINPIGKNDSPTGIHTGAHPDHRDG